MTIYFDIEDDIEISERFKEVVTDTISGSLEFMKCPYDTEINVTFTNNEGIQVLNKEYRDIDKPTDVLSFPMAEFTTPGDFDTLIGEDIDNFNQDTEELIFGDIILNIDRIKSQAVDYNHSEIRELAFLVAHSMLHLAGYDHMEDDERVVMEELQEQILTMKGYTRDYEEV